MNAQSSSTPRLNWAGLIKTIGPGILFAGAAIGVSHLVQSTRAGAMYGWLLAPIIILTMAVKYPFFQYPYRYMTATGESMLRGYQRVGNWMLGLFGVLVLLSGVLTLAAVTVVTAGLAGQLFPLPFVPAEASAVVWTIAFVAGTLALLLFGHYATLDAVIKAIMSVLAVATVAALGVALSKGSNALPNVETPALWDAAGITFLLGLMGWMPTPIDASVWPTLWAAERKRQTGHTPSRAEAMTDFHIGYFGTLAMALCFLGLGALVMFATGREFPGAAVAFAGEFFTLYTETLGNWSLYIVGLAALTCMISTTLTCFDAYTRTAYASFMLLAQRGEERSQREDASYRLLMGAYGVITIIIIAFFSEQMLAIVTVATVLAFLSAPIVGLMNYVTVMRTGVEEGARPTALLHVVTWIGLVYLAGFSMVWLYISFLQ